jgi:hypothetical protein
MSGCGRTERLSPEYLPVLGPDMFGRECGFCTVVRGAVYGTMSYASMRVCGSITLQVHNACFAFSTLCTGVCASQKSSVPHFCCNVCTCMYIVEFCTKNLKSQLQYSYMYFKKLAVGNSRIMLRVGKMQRFRGGWRPKKSGCQIGVAADVRHVRSSFGRGNM